MFRCSRRFSLWLVDGLLRARRFATTKIRIGNRLIAAMLAPHFSVFFRGQSDLGHPAGDVSWQRLGDAIVSDFPPKSGLWREVQSARGVRLCFASALAYALDWETDDAEGQRQMVQPD
jgi:hypothetical protein